MAPDAMFVLPLSVPPFHMNEFVVLTLVPDSVPATRSTLAIETLGEIPTVAPLILTVPVPVNEAGALMLWVPFANPRNAPEAVLNVPVCVMIAGLLSASAPARTLSVPLLFVTGGLMITVLPETLFCSFPPLT